MLNYYTSNNEDKLILSFYHLEFKASNLPFESIILPTSSMQITHTFGNTHHFHFKKKKDSLNETIVSGQFIQSYKFIMDQPGHAFGFSLHPTALHKITKNDLSKITNKHIALKTFSETLNNKLQPLFTQYEEDIDALKDNVSLLFNTLKLEQNSTIEQIDRVIEVIHTKEGLLNTNDVLQYISFSQKTLETNFKKIIGMTPGKYIRLFRFLSLMKKYESKKIVLQDLIYMYDYYDHSHFSKDFKYFMEIPPNQYFKNEHPFLNEYLKK